MRDKIRENLSRAKQLLEKGQYTDALELLNTLPARKDLPVAVHPSYLLLEIRLKILYGELEKARILTGELLQTARKEKNLLLEIDSLVFTAEISWRLGELEEGLEALERGEELLTEKGLKLAGAPEREINQRKGKLLLHRGIIYWYKGDLDKALEAHRQSLKISRELNNKKDIADSFNNLGLVYWSKGNLNQALEYHKQSLEINEELGNKPNIARSLSNLGNIYTRKGNLDKALACQKQGLAIREELGAKHDIFLSYINLGVIYQLKGDLDQALEYYQKSLVISEALAIKQDIALAINNLGNIYQLKGELDPALEFFQRSLTIYQELGIREQVALLLGNIGEIYRKKGTLKEALIHYQQSLVIYEELGNDPLIAIVLFELMWVALEREDSTLTQQYLQKLQQINERTDNRIIDQRYRVAQALALKASKRTRHQVKAGELLEQVAREEVGDHSLTVTAMIHLCDLLLSELKLTGEDELFGEIKDLTNRLLEIAQQQSSHWLHAEAYLLQSKLALIEHDLGRAQKLLGNAFSIAKDKGLDLLAQRLEHERDLLKAQIQKWDLIIKEKPSRQEMIDLTNLDGLLGKMIQETVTNLIDKRRIPEAAPLKKYTLKYLDLIKDSPKIVKHKFRVGLAQIGVSQTGDLLKEFYKEQAPGLFSLRKNQVKTIRTLIKNMVKRASSKEINLLIFPELTIDLNYNQLYDDVLTLAKTYNIYILPGSYHDLKTKENLSVVISPDGPLWKQKKHIPAIIHLDGKKITEGLDRSTTSREIIIGNTEYGRIAIILCRDFLDMDLRVELKNFEPPIDLIVNPAFTPVTADFEAAHFDARRSIYAYCFFANVAEFGASLIYTPERERVERKIPPKEENLIYKDIDLFKLRSERKKWELEQKKTRPFIQSTR